MTDDTTAVPDDDDPVPEEVREAWNTELRLARGEEVSAEEMAKMRQAIEQWNSRNLSPEQRDELAHIDKAVAASGSCSTEPLFYQDCCPRCRLHGSHHEMRLNSDDFWECPSCHLQGHTACAGFFALLETEGRGDWATGTVNASEYAGGWVLTIADPDDPMAAFTGGFSGERDLRAWLTLARGPK